MAVADHMQYIHALTQYAGVRSLQDQLILENIDDLRNGIYLSASLHMVFGKSLAFLVVSPALFGSYMLC